MKTRIRTLFPLFAVSGFCGLIYESIWSHYLKLFLGHAAYAQTLVLGLFMGGMAIGSWLCSRRSARWKNLLRGYALAEGFHLLDEALASRVDIRAVIASESARTELTDRYSRLEETRLITVPDAVFTGLSTTEHTHAFATLPALT